MIFEYTETVEVSEEDIQKMVTLCRQGYSYEQAIRKVTALWSESEQYAISNVIDQLVGELEFWLCD